MSIWDDPDFLALTAGAQRLYLFLCSQPDLALTGLLSLRERRWAKKAPDTPVDLLREQLKELACARFVVVDEDTEELLIRSLLRRDRVYRQPNVLRAAEKQVPLIASPTLRAVLANEVRRVLTATDMLATSRPIAERMLVALSGGPQGPDPSRRESGREPFAEPFGRGSGWTTRANPSPNPSGKGSAGHIRSTSRDSGDPGRTGVAPHSSAGQKGSPEPFGEPFGEGVLGDRGSTVVTTDGPLAPKPPSPLPCEPLAAGPPPVTPEEGEENSDQELIDEIRAVRPEWSARSIRKAIRHADVADRPPTLVADAMRLVAADPTSQAPGRLRGDGPWWAAARARQPKPAAEINPPCGNCDQNRQVAMPDGRMTRCPDCHPLRRAS